VFSTTLHPNEPMTIRPRILAALSLGLLASPLVASAQQPAAAAPAAPACPIDMQAPSQLALANLQRSKMVSATKPEDARKIMVDAAKLLFDPKSAANAVGRDYMLAQMLSLVIPFGGEIQPRAAVGYPGAGTVDLAVVVDSLLTIVEKAQPACKTEIAEWRQYKPFALDVQAAYKAFGDNKADSAEYYAKRALIFSKDGAQPYDVLWRVAQKKGDETALIANMKLAADKLIGDTSNVAVRTNLLFNTGRVLQEGAEKKAEPAKTEAYKASVEPFMTVLKESPNSEESPFALQGIATAATMAKSDALVDAALAVIKANPLKFSDVTLAQAGVQSTRMSRNAEAASFFEAAMKVNPYSRDYMYNYAAMLYESKRPTEMLPVVRNLVKLDPSNPDNVMLFAYAYKLFGDSVEANFVKPAAKDSAALWTKTAATARKGLKFDELKGFRAEYKRLIDSVTVYSQQGDGMPHQLTYTQFDKYKDRTILKGQIQNKGKAARSFTVEFEFLGKDGSVVDKKSVTVADVKPDAAGAFSVELTKGDVLGVRYAPLPIK
jgi:tetratricopeptide (TPR) repeat protein